jgi:lipopolysaccharide/colanic/teichoic acid biosynthesis glycosyltransferase
MRRAIDVVLVLLAGVVAVPFAAVVALAVRIDMGAPVLFRQERAGRGGRTFTLVKFRTMRDADYHGQIDTERIPPLGRFLRASGLDEIPQLWNILVGDMSIIGPRPALPQQAAHFSDRQRGRLAVRPGLTGWAQVNGRNAISWAERIELDLWYLAHRSPALDLRIVALTVLRVVRPRDVRGAGGVNEGFRTESGELIDIWSDAAPPVPLQNPAATLPFPRVSAEPTDAPGRARPA